MDSKIEDAKVLDKLYSMKKDNGSVSYWYRFTYKQDGKIKNGRGPRKASEKEAYSAAKEKVNELLYGKINEHKNLTVAEVGSEYIEYLLKGYDSDHESSIETTISRVRSLLFSGGGEFPYTKQSIKNRPISELTRDNLNSWVSSLYDRYKTKEISEATFKQFKGAIRKLLTFASRKDYIDYDTFERLEKVLDSKAFYTRSSKQKTLERDDRVITLEQFDRLISSIKYCGDDLRNKSSEEMLNNFIHNRKYRSDLVHYMIFKVLMMTGMRTSELRALTLDDLEYDDTVGGDEDPLASVMKININKGMSYKCVPGRREEYKKGNKLLTKTKNAKRIVSMSNVDADELLFYVRVLEMYYEKIDKDLNANWLLFPSEDDSYVSENFIDHFLAKCLEAIKDEVPKFSKHNFRGSFCTLMADKGMPKAQLAMYLGESDSRVLDRYYIKSDAETRYLNNLKAMPANAQSQNERTKDAVESSENNISDDIYQILQSLGKFDPSTSEERLIDFLEDNETNAIDATSILKYSKIINK